MTGHILQSTLRCLLLSDVASSKVNDALIVQRAARAAGATVKHSVANWDIIHGRIVSQVARTWPTSN